MMITYRTSFRVLSIVLILFYSISCTTNVSDTESETDSSTYTAHVALSGGGWRAHTAHSGWTLSLLNNGKRTLNDAFANVGTVSSNSGGSWFSTMLMYSDSFVSAIEAPNAINTWSTTGWLGQQQSLFDAASCHDLSGDKFIACVFETYATASRWNTIVADLVFKDYPINATLSSQRLPWAQDKPLLLAATMLTSQVVLNGSTTGDKQYYQACLSPATPVLNGNDGATCSEGTAVDVTPVTFSSLPGSSSLTAPPFLPAISATNPQFNVGYTQNAWISPATATATISNPLANDAVPVVIAAAASSAAGGFEASGFVSGDWEESFEAEDEALSFQLANSNVQFADASGLSVQDLANQKFVRIADGGPVDNSGVAQLVSFLQLNNQADGFNIVAFDNVQELYVPTNSSAANVGIDLANLFNAGICSGNKFCSGLDCDGTCVTTPNVQIFDSKALESTPLTWWTSARTLKAQGLIYTKYAVTTVDNASFGITAGTTGTLHAFTCVWANADTAPQNNTQDGDFDAYGAMLSFINKGLQQENGKGLKYLEAALGLSK